MRTIKIDQDFKGFKFDDVSEIARSAQRFSRGSEKERAKAPTCTMDGQTFAIVAVQTKRKRGKLVHRVQPPDGKMTPIITPAVVRWCSSRGLPPRLEADVKWVSMSSPDELQHRAQSAWRHLVDAATLIEQALQEIWGIETLEEERDEAAWAHFKATRAIAMLQSSEQMLDPASR